MTRTRLTLGAGCVAALIAAAGCSGYNNDRGRGDAPVGQQDRTPAEIVSFPDQFGNVAIKCDGHGHRMYVPTHANTDPSITVVDDPSCPGGPTR